MPPTNPHPPWCARGHHCGIHLDEHRTHPITLDLPDRGRAVLTRIRTGGTDRAEIRITIQLAAGESTARQQLAGLLHGLNTLLTRTTTLTRRGAR